MDERARFPQTNREPLPDTPMTISPIVRRPEIASFSERDKWSAVPVMREADVPVRREGGNAPDVEGPTVSLVLLGSEDDRETHRAVDVFAPLAADMAADLVVVIGDDSPPALRQRILAAGGLFLAVARSATRTEMCDAAMARVHSDIVLFRDATAARAAATDDLGREVPVTSHAALDVAPALNAGADADVAAAAAVARSFPGDAAIVGLVPTDRHIESSATLAAAG